MAGDADGAWCRAASLLALLQWDGILPSGKYPFYGGTEHTRGWQLLSLGHTLIDPNSVLTAAHCVVDADRINLAVGRTVRS
jgi:hypothetical protein